jgi:hypothetical protein
VGEVYSTKFIDLAHELGVIDNFRLLGSKSQDFIKELYRMSSVEAHDIEGIGLGTSSIEALASGTPVIAAVAPDHFFNEIDIEGLGVTLIAADDHTELAFALDSILSKEKLTFDSRSAYDYFYIGIDNNYNNDNSERGIILHQNKNNLDNIKIKKNCIKLNMYISDYEGKSNIILNDEIIEIYVQTLYQIMINLNIEGIYKLNICSNSNKILQTKNTNNI